MRAHADEPWSGLRIGVGPKNKLYFKTAAGWLSADGAEQRIAEVALDHVAEELKSAVTKARSRPAEFEGQFERSRSVGGNQARFKGTRIAVNVVIEMLRQGMSATAILQEMPTLKRKDIGAAKEVLLGDRKLPAA